MSDLSGIGVAIDSEFVDKFDELTDERSLARLYQPGRGFSRSHPRRGGV